MRHVPEWRIRADRGRMPGTRHGGAAARGGTTCRSRRCSLCSGSRSLAFLALIVVSPGPIGERLRRDRAPDAGRRRHRTVARAPTTTGCATPDERTRRPAARGAVPGHPRRDLGVHLRRRDGRRRHRPVGRAAGRDPAASSRSPRSRSLVIQQVRGRIRETLLLTIEGAIGLGPGRHADRAHRRRPEPVRVHAGADRRRARRSS